MRNEAENKASAIVYCEAMWFFFRVMAVDIDTTTDVFTSGTPHKLFATSVMPAAPPATPDYYYDVTPDGQKFLLNEPVPASPSQMARSTAAPAELPLNVIVNWSAGLR